MQTIGVVRGIWRFPVKSMGGERLSAADIGPGGMVGDRHWALRNDEAGEIQGGKKWPVLMQCMARYRGPVAGADLPPVDITLPDGALTATDDPALGHLLQQLIGVPASLWPLQPADALDHYRRRSMSPAEAMAEVQASFQRAPGEPLPDFSVFAPELQRFVSMPGDYFDALPLHLLTTTTLATLARLNPAADWDERRFRANLVIEPVAGSDAGAAATQPELDWIGRTLAIGDLRLAVVMPTPRCGMTIRAQQGLAADASILRTIVAHADQNLGTYARVARAGEVRVGDPVYLLP